MSVRVVLLYTRVLRKSDAEHQEHESYDKSAIRFRGTYLKFKPEIPHQLLVVHCGDAHATDGLFEGIACQYACYTGGGYDCGAYQEVGGMLDCDLVIGLNAHAYFWRNQWLEPFVYYAQKYGHGVYGASASYENHPHLRTPSIAFHPEVMRKASRPITNRIEALLFESGPDNFALFALANGYHAKLVTPSVCYDKWDWRVPANGFRRGDQSNCLIRDWHMDNYDLASPEAKLKMEQSADGMNNK